MCCLRLTNVQHCEKYFTRDKTTQAVVITNKQNFHTIKRRTFDVQHRFYFSDITNTKKLFKFEKIIF